jgi:hypothetical protein
MVILSDCLDWSSDIFFSDICRLDKKTITTGATFPIVDIRTFFFSFNEMERQPSYAQQGSEGIFYLAYGERSF